MAQPSSRSPKTVTVAQANALLPQVITLLEQLQGLQRSILATQQAREESSAKVAAGNGYPVQLLKTQIEELNQREHQLLDASQSAFALLEELGCELKDLNVGLIDFYGIRSGALVCLCWKLGEPRVQFWHTLEAGYAGRQPLDSKDLLS